MDDNSSKKVAVLGAGWLGFALAEQLQIQGRPVHVSSRSALTVEMLENFGFAGAFRVELPEVLPGAFFDDVSHLVLTLPPGGRQLGAEATERYLHAIQALFPVFVERPKLNIVFCSSTGVYGDARGEVDELTPLDPNTHSSRAVAAAERTLELFADRLTILRFAGLVGPRRHPGNFYGGKNRSIPQSAAPVNLVHQADAVNALLLALSNDLPAGVYNVCAAAHPSKGEFYQAAANTLKLATSGGDGSGIDGKTVSSAKLRGHGWQPTQDDLSIFLW